jgi:PB1 domain
VLRCRAEARYESGLYKDALSDVQKVNTADKSDSSAALEGKVRASLAGKAANGGTANGGSSAITEAPAAAQPKKQQYTKEQTASMLKQQPSQFACKVTLEAETKYVHVPFGISYYGLQQLIKTKWTGLANFKIYYLDKDADWVLLTNAKDVQRAQQEILAYAQRVINQRQAQGSQVRGCVPRGRHRRRVWPFCVHLQRHRLQAVGGVAVAASNACM